MNKVLNSDVDEMEDNVLSDNDRQNLRNINFKSLKPAELNVYIYCKFC